MPYTGKNDPDLPSNVKAMDDADREQWVSIFNSCLEDGTSEGDCIKLANGVVKEDSKSIISHIVNLLHRFIAPKKDRAISTGDLFMQVAYQAYALDDWAWLNEIYYEDSKLFAVLSEQGKLYKAEVSIDADGGNVKIADRDQWSEIVVKFSDVMQNKKTLRIAKDRNGNDRWFLIAGTTILNRNGEIDSSKLFDSMIEQCQSGEKDYPYLTYYHLKEAFKMGQCDFLARDGVALLASGTFENNKVAEAMKARYVDSPDTWGSSIGFMAEEAKMVEVSQGIKIPVYENGYLVEISILKEEDACAIGTALRTTEEVIRMNEKVKKALEALAGDDTELIDEFSKMVDQRNKAVEEQGLVHRGENLAEATAEAPAEAPAEEPAEDPTDPNDEEEDSDEDDDAFELNEEAVSEIAKAFGNSESFKELIAKTEQALADLTALSTELREFRALQIQRDKKVDARFEEIEKSDKEKQQALIEDMSTRQLNRRRFIFRPTQRTQDDDVEGLAETANATLQNIK